MKYMKNKFFALVALSLVFVTANARDYRTSGYMGFVEESTITDFDNFYGGINTTHGYQFNQHIFAGAGAGIIMSYDNTSTVGVPIYADFRYTMLKSKVTPFFEGKIGYAAADIGGFYASPAIGVDIAFTEKFGLYVGLAYEHYGAKEKTVDEQYWLWFYGTSYVSLSDLMHVNYYEPWSSKKAFNTISLRVGIHF